jgi:hypothetical protein
MMNKQSTNGKPDWKAIGLAIIQRLDVTEEYRALDVKIVGPMPNSDGWYKCHAVDREG